MTSHILSSRIHPRGTLPIMASKWQIKEGLLLMFNTLRWPLFGSFLSFHMASVSLLLTEKKSPKRRLTGGKWVFYFPRLKKPKIITARSALWVIDLVSGCDKCLSFWTCQKKMNLRCTTGHLGCSVSALYLNIPQDFQCGTNVEHNL